MHVVNLTNEGEEKSIPYLLGYLAGLSLDVSAIANPLKLDSVIEPDDLDEAINNGEFILYNDEGEVRVKLVVLVGCPSCISGHRCS